MINIIKKKQNWNQGAYLQKMLLDSKKHINIIALFAQKKEYTFNNYEQLQYFIKRNVRVAKRLDVFNLKKIEDVLEYLIETADYKVALETVEKYIFEDIKKLRGEKPILRLKDGEEIYDISRLKELEKNHKIYYQNDKWLEVVL